MKECCGNCGYNKRSFDRYCNAEFCCSNEDSELYGVPTDYEDCCDGFAEKE